MQTKIKMPAKALQALLALCDEALIQGGAPRGISLDDIEIAREIIGSANIIIIKE